MKSFKIYSLSSFKIYSTLLTIVTLLYIISLELIYHITGSLYLLTIFTHFTHSSLFTSGIYPEFQINKNTLLGGITAIFQPKSIMRIWRQREINRDSLRIHSQVLDFWFLSIIMCLSIFIRPYFQPFEDKMYTVNFPQGEVDDISLFCKCISRIIINRTKKSIFIKLA